MAVDLILASGSPRRKEILENLGVRFRVRVADVDESSDERDPAVLVEELARRKALAVREQMIKEGAWNENVLLLASDTVVAAPTPGGECILGKPRNAADADRMLRLLSGTTHRVVSGIALLQGEWLVSDHEVTGVEFDCMTDAERAFYIRSNEPFGKAGGYAVQGLASIWIKGLRGDYFNVVGLPVHRLFCLLSSAFGLRLCADGTLGPLE